MAAGEARVVSRDHATAATPGSSAPARAARHRGPAVQVALLVTTIVTMAWAGAAHVGVDLVQSPGAWPAGVPYALALLLILGVHELGHYFVGRARGVSVSLPYFIPAPFYLGTFGAFIRMNGEVRSRSVYFDIGVAGPLAGLVVAVGAVLAGVAFAPASVGAAHGMTPASSFLFAALFRMAGGGDPSAMVALGPVAFAGWLGLLVTALNLIPVGQLDGGHIAYALWGGTRSRQLGTAVTAVMVGLGLVYSPHWIMWALLVWVVAGTGHPAARDEHTELSVGRRALAYGSFVLLAAIVLPWPT